MARSRDDGAARPLVWVAFGLGLAILAFATYRIVSGPDEGAPPSTETPIARRATPRAEARDAREDDRVAAYDPARLAPLLLDGGAAPATLEAVDRRLAALPVAPASPEAPATEETAPAASSAPIVEWHREPTVESDLRRAVFLRGLLESQIASMSERADEARARGDEAVAARYERRLERLTRERPAIEARVAELEAQAGDGPLEDSAPD